MQTKNSVSFLKAVIRWDFSEINNFSGRDRKMMKAYQLPYQTHKALQNNDFIIEMEIIAT